MKERNINCDILRIIAFCLVVCVHSLGNIGFYGMPIYGKTMFSLIFLRQFFVICVPLFIIITGYLMKDKQLNKKYIFKLGRIILTYILCSIACYFIVNTIKGNTISFKIFITKLLDFTAAPYGWYVGMYLGLYLLIPFLNILWNNLKTKKHKQYLIFILFLLLVLPTTFNFYYLQTTPPQKLILYPNYWVGSWYPIIYYFVGCYLKEYKLNLTIKKSLIYLFAFMLGYTIFIFAYQFGKIFEWEDYVGYYSINTFIVASLVANLILNNLKLKPKTPKFKNIIGKVSYLTFGAYLLSNIFDSFIGNFFNMIPGNIKEKLFLWIPIIIVTITCSLIASYLIDLMQRLINYSYNKVKKIIVKT